MKIPPDPTSASGEPPMTRAEFLSLLATIARDNRSPTSMRLTAIRILDKAIPPNSGGERVAGDEPVVPCPAGQYP